MAARYLLDVLVGNVEDRHARVVLHEAVHLVQKVAVVAIYHCQHTAPSTHISCACQVTRKQEHIAAWAHTH